MEEPQEPQQLSKKERKALKRQQKQDLQQHERAVKKVRKTGIWLAVLVLGAALAAAAFILSRGSSEPLGQDFSREALTQGRQHAATGTRVPYASNPPTSGPHWPVPLSDGVYDAEKPDEAVVHSLEHGRVWISYKPSIPQEAVEQLRDIAGGAVILTPRSANDTDVALAAWGRLDTFDLENGQVPAKRIRDFIKRYLHQGPEYIPAGRAGGNDYEDYEP